MLNGILMCSVLLQSAAATADDWGELQSILSGIVGRYTAPPQLSDVVTNGYTAGQLLGNGDIAVTADARNHTHRFYIAKSGFFNPATQKLTFGSVAIMGPNSAPDPSEKILQEQDILNAEVRSTIVIEGQTVTMKTWVVESENLLVTELITASNAATIPIIVSVQIPSNASYPATSLAGTGIASVTRTSAAAPGNNAWFCQAAASTGVIGATATASAPSANEARLQFSLSPNTSVQIVTSIKGDARPHTAATPGVTTYRNSTVQRVAGLTMGTLTTLHQEHLDWWKKFWLKSYVKLNDAALEKFYYGGLYALGASIREGFIIPGTYSAWSNNDSATAKYYLNYNYEAPMYGVFTGNRPELAKPYYAPILSEAPYSQNKTAAAGYKGVCFLRSFAPLNIYGPAPALNPIASAKDFTKLPSDQKTNGTFAAIPFIWNYEYMGDTAFFSSTTYPFLKNLGEFWMDYLAKNAAGRYIVEHTAVNEGGHDLNSAYDLGYIRLLFKSLLKGSLDLGVDANKRTAWQDIVDHLVDYPTGTMSGFNKQVFYLAETINNSTKGNALLNIGDQPINLEGIVHPGDNYTIGSDDTKLQLVRNTLEYVNPFTPGSRGASMNGFPKTFTIAARAGWPAEDLISKFKAAISYGWRENLTVKQGGGAHETSGAIETINSMLLQTNGTVTRVFPCWPTARNAKFVRLRAKGAFLISSEMNNGGILYVDITSEKGNPITLMNPFASGKAVTLFRNGVKKGSLTGDTLSLTTSTNEVIELTPDGIGAGRPGLSAAERAAYRIVPAAGAIVVEFPARLCHSVSLFSLGGKSVYSCRVPASGRARIPLAAVGPGVFLVRVDRLGGNGLPVWSWNERATFMK